MADVPPKSPWNALQDFFSTVSRSHTSALLRHSTLTPTLLNTVCGGLGACAGGVWGRVVVCLSARRPIWCPRLRPCVSLSVCLSVSYERGLGSWRGVRGV
eukprot:scaffold91226_cov51-Phaeocystis_antarctica.AAC.3